MMNEAIRRALDGVSLLLDARALARHRPGAVLAAWPGAVGRSFALPSGPPHVRLADAPGSSSAAPTPAPGSLVAVVTIRGPLAQRAELGLCGGYVDGYDAIGARIAASLGKVEVGSVVLAIDSPGGDVAGLEEMVRQARAAVTSSGKPVLAYVDELAASAAYWIVAGIADGGIYLPESARVGSIGTIATHVDESAALAKEGLKVTFVREPDGKANPNSVESLDTIGRGRMEQLVRDATARFVGAMATARGLPVSAIRGLNGSVLQGADAVAKGLANGISGLDGVIARAGAEASRRRGRGYGGAAATSVPSPAARVLASTPAYAFPDPPAPEKKTYVTPGPEGYVSGALERFRARADSPPPPPASESMRRHGAWEEGRQAFDEENKAMVRAAMRPDGTFDAMAMHEAMKEQRRGR